MTRPTDAAIARAFWKVDGFIDLDRHERRILEIITAEARKIDAEAGGTARQTEEEMQIEAVQHGHPHDPVASAADGRAAAPLPLYTAMIAGPYCRYCGRETHHMGDICFSCGKERKHDMSKIPEQITTPPERVQIPAESEHVAPYTPPDGKVACPIPTCRAELLPGQSCGGVNCGLRRTE